MNNQVSIIRYFFIALCILSIVIGMVVQPLGAAEQDVQTKTSLQGKKVAMVIPFERYNRYMHEEFTSAFASHGLKMSVISSQTGMATPNQGTVALAVEKTIHQMDMAQYDALIFSGGGSLYSDFANKPETKKIIDQAVRLNKVIGGIDLGKAVLVNTGIVAYQLPKERDAIGAAFTVNGNIITGNSAYVITPFIESVLKAMQQNG